MNLARISSLFSGLRTAKIAEGCYNHDIPHPLYRVCLLLCSLCLILRIHGWASRLPKAKNVGVGPACTTSGFTLLPVDPIGSPRLFVGNRSMCLRISWGTRENHVTSRTWLSGSIGKGNRFQMLSRPLFLAASPVCTGSIKQTKRCMSVSFLRVLRLTTVVPNV